MNIVFDIGNVICEWNAKKLVRSVFRDEDEQQKALQDIIGHADWLSLDRGSISLEDAAARAVSRTNIQAEKVWKLYRDTPPSLVPFPQTLSLINDLKNQGHNLYVLSNMHRHAYEYLIATYNFWSNFSGIVISSHIESIKPEPEIYKYLLTTWSLRPEDTIFLDDLPTNLATADRLGIQTILVDSPHMIRPALAAVIPDLSCLPP